MARDYRPNLKQALRDDIFALECCGGCGRETGKFYILLDGMYAGTRYCRSCAVEHLYEMEEEE
jgi:hypothetical protein